MDTLEIVGNFRQSISCRLCYVSLISEFQVAFVDRNTTREGGIKITIVVWCRPYPTDQIRVVLSKYSILFAIRVQIILYELLENWRYY